MKTTDIGFERFPEDFYADLSTAFIKTDLEEYTKIVKSSSTEQREKFLENKKPYVMAAWEHYIKREGLE